MLYAHVVGYMLKLLYKSATFFPDECFCNKRVVSLSCAKSYILSVFFIRIEYSSFNFYCLCSIFL